MSRFVCEPCGVLFDRAGSCPFCRARLRPGGRDVGEECPNCGLEFARERTSCPLCQGRQLRREAVPTPGETRGAPLPQYRGLGALPLRLEAPARRRAVRPSLVTAGLLLAAAVVSEVVVRPDPVPPTVGVVAAHADPAAAARATAAAVPAAEAERLNGEAVALARAGRMEEAIVQLTRAVALDARHFKSYNNLGVLYRRTGRVQEAISAYQTASALQPSNPVPYKNLGILFEDRQDLPDAIRCYGDYLRLAPDAADVVVVRAHLQELEGRLRHGPLAARPRPTADAPGGGQRG